MRYKSICRRIAAIVVVALLTVPLGFAQDVAADDLHKQRFEKFATTMSGAKLVGQFTMTGADNKELTAEEYHIHEVKKLDEGDFWMFKARVKYGGRDVTVPMPLEVKWAANTPVITLDEVEIPLLGKFSARVVIDGNKYAGTWSHGEVGGHLFGEIARGQAEPEKSEQKQDK